MHEERYDSLRLQLNKEPRNSSTAPPLITNSAKKDEAKRKRCCDVVLGISRWISVDDVIGDVIIFSRWLESSSRKNQQSKLQWIQSQRKDFQTQCLSNQTQEDKSIIVEEDSGKAFDEPDASNSSIQSRAYLNQLLLYIQSRARGIPGAKNCRSSKAQQLKNESAAKQLTTYEELSKLDVNC
ncbi:hypothetical protein F511_39876 [Dorcoceras hygrometricum]|uniref:Uncharacterized protein n=1 Tax=Dorcoceras hygrometricum TaxID=472368 RepID=A0A2Z7D351_9LAMI|nr:hypothetical protein F511_39876 [Dorcoceras hygrometricum]